MKTKELKNLAKKIAKAEKRIQEAQSVEEKEAAENEVLTLCGRVTNITDMLNLDEFVQEALEELS